MHQVEIINDLEGLFSQNLQFDPPTIRHKRLSVTIVCIPFSTGLWDVSLLSNFLKRGGGLEKISVFRGALLVKRAATFSERVQLLHKK